MLCLSSVGLHTTTTTQSLQAPRITHKSTPRWTLSFDSTIVCYVVYCIHATYAALLLYACTADNRDANISTQQTWRQRKVRWLADTTAPNTSHIFSGAEYIKDLLIARTRLACVCSTVQCVQHIYSIWLLWHSRPIKQHLTVTMSVEWPVSAVPIKCTYSVDCSQFVPALRIHTYILCMYDQSYERWTHPPATVYLCMCLSPVHPTNDVH